MKKAVLALLLMFAVALPMAAKDKAYQDATILKEDKLGVGAMQAVAAGAMGVGKSHSGLVLQVADVTYGGMIEKKLKHEDWPEGKVVKVRFEVKGGGLATRTKLFVVKDDGKELEFDVKSIVIGDKDYCGTRKCDLQSARKQAAKS